MIEKRVLKGLFLGLCGCFLTFDCVASPPHGESTLEHLRSNALEIEGVYELHTSDQELFLSTWGINPDPNLPEEELFKALEDVEQNFQHLLRFYT